MNTHQTGPRNRVLLGNCLLLALTTGAFAQPVITNLQLYGLPQTPADSYHAYANPSASPGANVYFKAQAKGTAPLQYHWLFNQAALADQTNSTLVLTNLQITNAGLYTVVVSNNAGSDSAQANLIVDPTFTKISTGPIVTNGGYCVGGTWADYNQDGLPDLFVFNGVNGVPWQPFLYRNDGAGAFTSITTGPLVNDLTESYSACWGDYDNDGYPDLFVSSTTTNLLFRNNGDGTFTQIFDSPVVEMSNIGVWVDFDRDGLLDLFLCGFDPTGNNAAHNFMFRNNGDGTFSPVINAVTTDAGSFLGGAWADYDGDGNPDLFLPSADPLQPNRLYHNNGDGTFTRIMVGDLVTDPAGQTQGCAWGDYDNDGRPDLFVAKFDPHGNVLYHNDGNGIFSRVLGDPTGGNELGKSAGCAWGDYDNDGLLDLFVTCGAPPEDLQMYANLLYHNNGDGKFSRILLGSPVNEYSTSFGCSWVDYNNDGFLDLFASLQRRRGAYLYRNNGNSNSWLAVKLVGVASNRTAIGAQVQVKTFYAGAEQSQWRQITGSTGFLGHDELQANFGLADATNIDLVEIHWPSGIVQTLTNVVPKRVLTVVEHQQITPAPAAPVLSLPVMDANGAASLNATGQTGLLYVLESSTNLVQWTRLNVQSNATGTVQFTDPQAGNYPERFYRVTIP